MDNYIICDCGSRFKYNKYYYEKHKETLKHLNYSRFVNYNRYVKGYNINIKRLKEKEEEEEKLILDINNLN